MEQISKRFTAVILALAVAVTLFAGCGKTPKDSETDTVTTTAESTTGEITTLTENTTVEEKTTAEEVTTAEEATTEESTTVPKTEPTTRKVEVTTKRTEITTQQTEIITKKPEPTTNKPVEPTTKKEEPTTKKDENTTEKNTEKKIDHYVASTVIVYSYDDIFENEDYYIFYTDGTKEGPITKPYSPGNEPQEIIDFNHCQYCGKACYYKNGHYACSRGGCTRFMKDVNCPECGKFVPAATCHTCGK